MLTQLASVGCSTSGVILIQGNDRIKEYEEILSTLLPPTWLYKVLPENLGFCGGLNKGFEFFPHESFYGALSDDEFILTPGWDKILTKAAGDWYIAHGNDHWQSQFRIHGAMTFGGELVRTIGYLSPPGMWHWYMDNFWEHLGAQCGIRKYCKDVLVEDRHYLSGKSQYDDTYRMGESRKDQDAIVFHEWCKGSLELIRTIREKLPRQIFNWVGGSTSE